MAPVACFVINPVVDLGGFNTDTSASLPGTGGYAKSTWDYGDGTTQTFAGLGGGHIGSPRRPAATSR